MAELAVKSSKGEDAGKMSVSDVVFGVEPNANSIRVAYDQYRANQRAGTHSTKTRAAVSGGGRKPYRQKGTGRARQGSIRSVQWRGGAIAFGPSPRDYGYRINRKTKRSAIRSALSDMAREGRLIVVDDFGVTEPKTKQLAENLAAMGCQGPALIATRKTDRNVALSARNLPLVQCINADNLNIYDLLTHDYLVATREAIEHFSEVFA